MELTEYQKNSLLVLMREYMKLKENALLPVLNEVISSIELGRVEDAYQARYIRDAIYSSEDNKEKYKEFEDSLVENFFN